MKKILLVTDQKGWGGWVRGQYIKKYLSDEFIIDLMDMKEFGEYEIRSNRNIFTIHEFEKFKENNDSKDVFKFDQFKKSLIRRDNRYDMVYFLFHTMLVAQKVRRFVSTGIKNMTIVTGYPTIKPIFKKEKKTTFHKFSQKCSAIGANNLLSLEDLKTHYSGKTFYAPRGVDPDIFYPMASGPKNEDDDFVVAYVGKPVPEKGLNSIIKPACRRANCKLIINDRNYTNALSPKEMNEFYNEADVYVVASTIDGTPNPALEAAACGKPIISNYIGNMPEFIENGYNGFLIKRENGININKYIYWLKKLSEERELCFEMGMNARKTILENWTWEKVTENERKIFREILNG